MTDKNTTQEKHPKEQQGQQCQQRKPWQKNQQKQYRNDFKKKDPEEIPVLKYGPANNFSKFKEAISKSALKNYGQLGKLIKLGKYYVPEEPLSTDYDFINDPLGVNKAAYLEDMKEYRKEIMKMRNERPKLYALILQYLSDESLEEIKRSDKFEKIDEETDPLNLWLLVEETHKVTSISKVEAVTKLAARSTYATMRQGPYESIITYKERFTVALKAYDDQGNPKLEDRDIAMDFFRGLDNARYATFKTEIMNGLTSKAIEQPDSLNAMYLLANQWLKTTTKTNLGYATTFTTTLDYQEKSHRRGKNKKDKNKRNNDDKKTTSDKSEKSKTDMSEIECYACGENGHYANKCPKRQNKEEEQEEERSAHLTWNANTFTTYQVLNASQKNSFGPFDVLIDNQANVSVMHPDLLRDVRDADEKININGVGGHQFSVTKTGFLDPLFRVYASEDTHANILSLSEVEDKFLVTYVPQDSFIIHLPETDIVFRRKAGMYVADWRQYKHVYATASTAIYTKAEEVRAKIAYDLLRTSGYPSIGEAVHLIQDGNITGMPTITVDDLRRAYDIYGTPPEYVRGKMTKRKVSRAIVDQNIIMEEKRQVLSADVMHIDGKIFNYYL